MNAELFLEILRENKKVKTVNVYENFDGILGIELFEDEYIVLIDACASVNKIEKIQNKVLKISLNYVMLDCVEIPENIKQEYLGDIDEYEYIIKSIKKDLKNYRDDDTEYLENQVDELKNKLIGYNSKVYETNKQIIELKYKIENSKSKNTRENERLKSILKIKDNEFVKSVNYIKNRKTLKIVVDNYQIYEPISDRLYKGTETLIELPLDRRDYVKFKNTPNSELHINYWNKKNPEAIHPHVDISGYACFGNADAQLAEYMNVGLYYETFLTALGFLQSVNVEDVAGYAISYWDEVDSEGNVITEGHAPEYEEYGFESDYAKEYNENDYRECDYCGEEIIEDDLTYIEGIGYVCPVCMQENFERCNGCHNDYEAENMHYDEEEDRYYCENCWEDHLQHLNEE